MKDIKSYIIILLLIICVSINIANQKKIENLLSGSTKRILEVNSQYNLRKIDLLNDKVNLLYTNVLNELNELDIDLRNGNYYVHAECNNLDEIDCDCNCY